MSRHFLHRARAGRETHSAQIEPTLTVEQRKLVASIEDVVLSPEKREDINLQMIYEALAGQTVLMPEVKHESEEAHKARSERIIHVAIAHLVKAGWDPSEHLHNETTYREQVTGGILTEVARMEERVLTSSLSSVRAVDIAIRRTGGPRRQKALPTDLELTQDQLALIHKIEEVVFSAERREDQIFILIQNVLNTFTHLMPPVGNESEESHAQRGREVVHAAITNLVRTGWDPSDYLDSQTGYSDYVTMPLVTELNHMELEMGKRTGGIYRQDILGEGGLTTYTGR